MMNTVWNGRPHLRLGKAVRVLLAFAGVACVALMNLKIGPCLVI